MEGTSEGMPAAFCNKIRRIIDLADKVAVLAHKLSAPTSTSELHVGEASQPAAGIEQLHELARAVGTLGITLSRLTSAQEAKQIDVDWEVQTLKSSVRRSSDAELPFLVDKLRLTLGRAPNSANCHAALADALLRQGRLSDAIEEYRTAVQCEPGSVGAHQSLGDLLREEGLFRDAEHEFRTCISIDPNVIFPRIWLSKVLQDQEKLSEAESELLMALALPTSDPFAVQICLELGSVRATLGDRGGALAAWQDGIERSYRPSVVRDFERRIAAL